MLAEIGCPAYRAGFVLPFSPALEMQIEADATILHGYEDRSRGKRMTYVHERDIDRDFNQSPFSLR